MHGVNGASSSGILDWSVWSVLKSWLWEVREIFELIPAGRAYSFLYAGSSETPLETQKVGEKI